MIKSGFASAHALLVLKRQRDLSVFLRFGAFYFSRTVGMVPVLIGKSMTPLLKYGSGIAKNETSGWYCSFSFFDTMKSHHSRIVRGVKRSKPRC